jgi:hypothetical protein
MTKREQKEYDILMEMYRRAFAASTPVGDFDNLMEIASLNEFGQPIVPYWEYECDGDVMDKIVVDVLKEYKVPKLKRTAFRTTFMLGCSPKTKQIKCYCGHTTYCDCGPEQF